MKLLLLMLLVFQVPCVMAQEVEQDNVPDAVLQYAIMRQQLEIQEQNQQTNQQPNPQILPYLIRKRQNLISQLAPLERKLGWTRKIIPYSYMFEALQEKNYNPYAYRHLYGVR